MNANLIIIQNANAYIEDINKRMKEMASWGESWKQSSFYIDLINQKSNWIRRKNQASKAIRDNSF